MTIVQGSDKDHPRCLEHDSPSRYTITIGNVGIPMCQVCMKDLKKKLESMNLDAVDAALDRRNT